MRRLVVSIALGVAAAAPLAQAADQPITTATIRTALRFGPGCTLRVMMDTKAPPAAVRAVGSRLEASTDFERIVFVPKAVALALMRHLHPGDPTFRLLPFNPLPDSYNATTAGTSHLARLVASVRGWRDVSRVLEVDCPSLAS